MSEKDKCTSNIEILQIILQWFSAPCQFGSIACFVQICSLTTGKNETSLPPKSLPLPLRTIYYYSHWQWTDRHWENLCHIQPLVTSSVLCANTLNLCWVWNSHSENYEGNGLLALPSSPAGFLFGLPVNSEDRNNMFLRKVGFSELHGVTTNKPSIFT